jgi:branched-chain amino acid aminotransferase
MDLAHKQGFSSALFLDAREKKYIDEAGPANFFGIKNNTYITPDSHSILPSITNKSIRQLAIDMGMKVEIRPVPVEELATFEEVGACGTAAVISPVKAIVDDETGKTYSIGSGEPGPWSKKLYERLTAIQNGEAPDPYGWVEVVG